MQAEGGRTIERRRGTRAATTFRKLPSARPGAKAARARAKSTCWLSAGRLPELRDHQAASFVSGWLAADELRQLGQRVHRGVARHPGRDEGEAVERGVRRLSEDD